MQFACALNPKWPHRALSRSLTLFFSIIVYTRIFFERATPHTERGLSHYFTHNAHTFFRAPRVSRITWAFLLPGRVCL